MNSKIKKHKANFNFIFRKNQSKLAWRKIENSFIILHIPTNEIYELNDMGGYIWNKIDGKKSLKEIITEITEEVEKEFETKSKQILEDDIMKFVNKLFQWNLIELKNRK